MSLATGAAGPPGRRNIRPSWTTCEPVDRPVVFAVPSSGGWIDLLWGAEGGRRMTVPSSLHWHAPILFPPARQRVEQECLTMSMSWAIESPPDHQAHALRTSSGAGCDLCSPFGQGTPVHFPFPGCPDARRTASPGPTINVAGTHGALSLDMTADEGRGDALFEQSLCCRWQRMRLLIRSTGCETRYEQGAHPSQPPQKT